MNKIEKGRGKLEILGQSSDDETQGYGPLLKERERLNWRPSEVVRLLSSFLGWHHQYEPEPLNEKQIWTIVSLAINLFPFSLIFRHFLGFIKC